MNLTWENFVRAILVILPYFLMGTGGLLILSIAHTLAVRIAENRIIKHYLPSIEKGEVQRLSLENKKLKIESKELKEKNNLYVKTLAGVRYLVSKENGE